MPAPRRRCKHIFFEGPRYCRYSPILLGTQESIENMISSEMEKWNQVENFVTAVLIELRREERMEEEAKDE